MRTTSVRRRAVALALSCALPACWGMGNDGQSGGSSSEIKAGKVANVPIEDPLSAAWDAVPETTVTMLPQSITYPLLTKASITELRVRALVDDKWVALRL